MTLERKGNLFTEGTSVVSVEVLETEEPRGLLLNAQHLHRVWVLQRAHLFHPRWRTGVHSTKLALHICVERSLRHSKPQCIQRFIVVEFPFLQSKKLEKPKKSQRTVGAPRSQPLNPKFFSVGALFEFIF